MPLNMICWKIKEIRDMDRVTIKPHAVKHSSASSISCLLGMWESWVWFTQSSYSLNICMSFGQMHPLPEWQNLTTGNGAAALWKDPILVYKVNLAAMTSRKLPSLVYQIPLQGFSNKTVVDLGGIQAHNSTSLRNISSFNIPLQHCNSLTTISSF